MYKPVTIATFLPFVPPIFPLILKSFVLSLQYLENVKREAIEETIARITTHFKEIFMALVPGGNAELIPTSVGDANNNTGRNNANDNAVNANSANANDDNAANAVNASANASDNNLSNADTQSEISTASSSVSSSQLRWGHHRLDNFGLDVHGRTNNRMIKRSVFSMFVSLNSHLPP